MSILSPITHVLSISMNRGSRNSAYLKILGWIGYSLMMALMCLSLVTTGVQAWKYFWR